MRLAEALDSVVQLDEPKEFEQFAHGIDPEWVEAALQETGKASLRRRRLPAAQVVWLVIGMGLFRNRPIWQVVDKLELAVEDKGKPLVANSACIQARQRLGEEPVQWLFERCGSQWAHSSSRFAAKPPQASGRSCGVCCWLTISSDSRSNASLATRKSRPCASVSSPSTA